MAWYDLLKPMKNPEPPAPPPKPQRPTIEHVNKMTEKHGWFQKQLWLVESTLWGRWSYWLAMGLNHTVGDPKKWPIPQVPFESYFGPSNKTHFPQLPASMQEQIGTTSAAVSHVQRVFESCRRYTHDLTSIVRWWLWAFGDPSVEERPSLPDEVAIIQYHELNLAKLIGNPTDWGSVVTIEWVGQGKGGTAWFPTPLSIATMMTQMTMAQAAKKTGKKSVDTRLLSVNDPCVGTGVFMLTASNYSLNLSCNDIDLLMVSWTRFMSWLFIPWLVYPMLIPDLKSPTADVAQGGIKQADALGPQGMGTPSPKKKKKVKR